MKNAVFVEAWRAYRAKACVNHESVQRKVNALERVVFPALLVAERGHLSTAIAHAMLGEGRREFDRVCEEIEARLGL